MLRQGLKRLKLTKIKQEVIRISNIENISSLKTSNGNTQSSERLSIGLVKKALDNLDYSYTQAGSQQSKDFQNVCNIGINIEVKKIDGFEVYFNDTLPSSSIDYIIMFTGKIYKTKPNIPPKIMFINGYDIVKNDLYEILAFSKEMEEMKNKWCRKNCKGGRATKLKNMSMYVRPTYKTSIKHIIDNPKYTVTFD
jgi:hypothetical protein